MRRKLHMDSNDKINGENDITIGTIKIMEETVQI
jgi:hypothetical protein